MLGKICLYLIILNCQAFAMDCHVAAMLTHPEIAANTDFWEKFGALKKHDNASVEALVKQYSADATKTLIEARAPLTAVQTQQKFDISRKAEKGIEKLSKVNKKNLDDAIKVINEEGVQGFYKQPGRWHHEMMIKQKGYSGKEHNVRLDGEFRMVFEIKDGVAHILDVGKHIGH